MKPHVGWVGSNVLIGRLPLDARIYVVRDSEEVPHSKVREEWKRFAFLKSQSLESKGWLSDVLACVRSLPPDFALADAYAFEGKLGKLHPGNKHVRDKIRQQLQLLRDHGIIEFLGAGRYRMK